MRRFIVTPSFFKPQHPFKRADDSFEFPRFAEAEVEAESDLAADELELSPVPTAADLPALTLEETDVDA